MLCVGPLGRDGAAARGWLGAGACRLAGARPCTRNRGSACDGSLTWARRAEGRGPLTCWLVTVGRDGGGVLAPAGPLAGRAAPGRVAPGRVAGRTWRAAPPDVPDVPGVPDVRRGAAALRLPVRPAAG